MNGCGFIEYMFTLFLVLGGGFFGNNYTLYKNAGFWLANSRDIFLLIQALHCEFAEFLLHVGVFG